MKPIIGVTPDFNAGDRQDMGGREPTYFLRARYLQAIEHSGGIPLMLPLISDSRGLRRILSQVSGILITGSGSDLAPELYGEQQRFKFRLMSQARSTLELSITKLAYRNNVPILGICGGIQSLNVALGGTLVQDIPMELNTSVPHQPAGSATKLAHLVQVAPRSLLRRITGRATIHVNSSHHQSIKRVAPPLLQTAVAPDGVIEAVEAQNRRFCLGVQWHPEYLYDRDPIQKRLFHAFVRAAESFFQTPKD